MQTTAQQLLDKVFQRSSNRKVQEMYNLGKIAALNTENPLVNLQPHPPQIPPSTHHPEPFVISTSDAVMMLYYTKVLAAVSNYFLKYRDPTI
jgi:hypothetical protein